jgi:exopolysaccharide/PEP-CTERM locus tyrosine autokinase
MNLIEQAAKRLEELKQAGAELPETHRGEGPRPAIASTPTPEGVMRAFESHRPAAIPIPGLRARPGDEPPRPHAVPAEDRSRRVELDLDALKRRGFVTPDALKSQIADEFRVLKRPIIRNALGRMGARVERGNLVMVTSALPGEGKTFTSLNLALSMAMEVDSTVLLVDGDVAHPAIPALLGTPHGPGLLDLLTRDDIDFADALVRTNVEKLSVLPAGSRHRRSTELLASEQMASLLRELASRYEDRIIIFDSPPLLATTEARVLATHMGQVVMVVAADATSHHAVTQALATIENCEVVLMALNKARRTDVGTYYGYYADDSAP